MQVVISSGHGLYVRGAAGLLDEVEEARAVVERVADVLRNMDVEVTTFHDDVSKSQDENLNRIVDFHNSLTRDLDISIHFNAYEPTASPMGTEVLYVTQQQLAADLAMAIAAEGSLINRGAKERSDLFFLNQTSAPAVLIEVCFVDSEADALAYEKGFADICTGIAAVVAGDEDDGDEEEEPPPFQDRTAFQAEGKVSWFGGPTDMGVSPDEGLAFFYEVNDAPYLFLPDQPPGTTGLARRLDPSVFYIACRWDYNITPKDMLRSGLPALVRVGNLSFQAAPADWGPHEDTDRVADISPGLMEALGLTTDDRVEVIYPAPEYIAWR